MSCHPTRGHAWRAVGPTCYCGAATWGVNPVRIVVHDGPDQLGRYTYGTYVQTDYTPGHPEGEAVRRETGQVHFGALPVERAA